MQDEFKVSSEEKIRVHKNQAKERLDQKLAERVQDFRDFIEQKKQEVSQKEIYKRNPKFLELALTRLDKQLDDYIEDAETSSEKFKSRLDRGLDLN